ncbi:MAG: FecR domain-containing protein, partial [Myxococcales bacterium]|nr:FecR domain-containing protein [Myxococcales bacterium]
MSERAEKYEAFLDDLALVVEGDPEALERHADFLVDDDEARDLRHEAAEVVKELEVAGADYVHAADFEERFLAVLDGGLAEADDPGRTTNPGFAAPDLAPAPRAEDTAPEDAADEGTAQEEAPRATARTVELDQASLPGAEPTPEKEAPKARTEAPRRKGKLLLFPLIGGLALTAAAAAIGVAVFGPDDDASEEGPAVAAIGLEGTLVRVARAAEDGQSGVEIQRPGEDGFVPLVANGTIAPGSMVRTDDRTRARVTLSDGSYVVLDHATRLELRGDAPRGFRLTEGNLVADIAHLEDGPNATFETTTGGIEVLGTKFELSATSDLTSVRVSRGVVSVHGADGEAREVNAGEEGVVQAGTAPTVTPYTELARSMAWSELGSASAQGDEEAAAEDADTLAGIGSLRARRPGERQEQERPLHLARHSVRVRIVGNVARTEIEEVFRNDDDATLEGVYRFPLPPDAQIASLSLDVDGRMEQGSFVERDRAAAIWRGVIRNATPVRQRQNDEEFIWV